MGVSVCIDVYFIHTYMNIDKANIYNLSVYGYIFIYISVYSSAWPQQGCNCPKVSAESGLFLLIVFKCLWPCPNQNLLWENGRWCCVP